LFLQNAIAYASFIYDLGILKMKKNILSVLLFAFVCYAVFGQNINDFEYETKNDNITITKYKGSVKDVVIPEKINGLPVVAIGRMAFMNSRLTSVILPNSLTSIGLGAFYNNQLTNVIIPNSVNKLTSINITASVTTIGLFAFDSNVEKINQ
jgi:hypothetical protein